MFRVLLALWLGLSFAATASSADIPGIRRADDGLERARSLIASKDWNAALPVLQAVVRSHPRDADGHNLLGYTLRNLKRYDESLASYKEALRLDPNHRGAHEYIGVAYVQLGQLEQARQHLAQLERICGLQCEEYLDLKAALAKGAPQ